MWVERSDLHVDTLGLRLTEANVAPHPHRGDDCLESRVRLGQFELRLPAPIQAIQRLTQGSP